MANSGKQWLAVNDDLRKSQKDKKKKPEKKPKKDSGGLLGGAIRSLRDRKKKLGDL